MSIKVGEIGKQFNYGTYFDISGFSELTLKLTSPSGSIVEITTPRVTAPAVDLVTEIEKPDGTMSQVTFPASTYMQFTTLDTDFAEAGEWKVCGTYEDATPKKFFGDDATFTVESAC